MASGYHILGGSSDRVITVRVRNALALAKGQSALASAASLVPGAGPDFVEGQAYQAIAQKIGEALAGQKAEAEVQVVDGSAFLARPRVLYTAPAKPASVEDGDETPAWRFTKTYGWGVATGGTIAAVALLVWRHFFHEAA